MTPATRWRGIPSRMGSTTAAVLAGGCALLVAACFSGDPEGSMGPLPADCRQLAIAAGVNPDDDDVAVVGIRGFAFVPAEITVSVGTEVVWVNCEPAGTGGGDHTSTSDTGEWSSPLLTRGDVFERVFDEAGAFEYHCEPHPFMQGTVTVTP